MKCVNRFKWLCNNCKSCQACTRVSSEKLTKCNTCERTFHQNCYPLTVSLLNGKTYCTDCINCKNCSRLLPILTIVNQNDLLTVKGFRVCDECWNYYKNVKNL